MLYLPGLYPNSHPCPLWNEINMAMNISQPASLPTPLPCPGSGSPYQLRVFLPLISRLWISFLISL